MDRAFLSGASESQPSAPASPSIGYPTAGNPGSGTPATTPGPYWYHMIMEELMAIISSAGITPNQGDLNQLLTALRSTGVFQTQPIGNQTTKVATTAFVNPGHSFSASGYQRLPSGLIIQWGNGGSGAVTKTVTFPVAFPTAVLSMQCTDASPSFFSVNFSVNPTLVGASIFCNSDPGGFYWIAIGY